MRPSARHRRGAGRRPAPAAPGRFRSAAGRVASVIAQAPAVARDVVEMALFIGSVFVDGRRQARGRHAARSEGKR